MKTALVLSGGSIKGAFQAGAIAEVLKQGFLPGAIYGTSVGSLNGAFLAERAGQVVRAGRTPDWPAIGKALERFWIEHVTSSSVIARKRGTLALVWAIARKRFDGLVDTSPLQRLVEAVFDPADLAASPVPFCACAVNVATGAAVYAAHDDPDVLDYVIASTAIPIEMPIQMIGGQPYVDGGIREVAPLRRAIEEDADEIVCILCQPHDMADAIVDLGDLFALAPRLMGIVTNELANNDLVVFDKVNRRVAAFEQARQEIAGLLAGAGVAAGAIDAVKDRLLETPYGGWRQIPLRVIRPEAEIELDLLDFTPEQIRAAIQLGREAARVALASRP